MRLLPKDQDWTTYCWLVYMPYFVAAPFLMGAPAWQKWAAVAATPAALALYFAGYWLRGARALWVVGGFAALASLFVKINPGASVLFVYAACCLRWTGTPAVAFRYLAALLALVGLETWLLPLDAWVWVPSLVFSGIMGSVLIQHEQRRQLNEKLLRAQGEVAHLAKVAERERIARDLHDLLGHTLSVIILKSELASRLAATEPERAASEIRDVEKISRDALVQVRAAVRGYRSLGIENELRQAIRTLETAGIRVESSVEPPPLSPAQEGVFAMAVREAVTNVLRHAHATFCRLTLRRAGEYCELEVADDGRGGTLDEGSGLSGMRQRVEALGGALERDGSRGTVLRIRVPV